MQFEGVWRERGVCALLLTVVRVWSFFCVEACYGGVRIDRVLGLLNVAEIDGVGEVMMCEGGMGRN